MPDLPKSLQIGTLVTRQPPADHPHGEVLAAFYQTPAWIRLKKEYPDARVNILDNNGKPVPDDTPVGVVRDMINNGTAHISIDDGSGGEMADA